MILPSNSEIAGIKVELPDIEKTFRDIWKDTTGDGSDKAVVKASTLNLIITFNDKEQYLDTLALIPEVTSHYPCRIIMILINPELDTEKITAYISAFCRPPRRNGIQLCCELITLETGAAGENHLPGILLPLLLPDLPVFLWSPYNLFLNNLNFQDFHKNIERVILYSPDSFRSIDELYGMASYVLNATKLSKISDITWAKLTNWREAVARFFDVQDYDSYLNNIHAIHIEHAGSGISTDAYLLTGWISSRLDWTLVTSPLREINHIVFSGPLDNKIDLYIKKTGSGKNAGSLTKLEIKTRIGDKNVIFTAEQNKKNTIKTAVTCHNSKTADNFIQNTLPDNARLLCYELDFIKEDKIYIEAVKKIWEIINKNKTEKDEAY